MTVFMHEGLRASIDSRSILEADSRIHANFSVFFISNVASLLFCAREQMLLLLLMTYNGGRILVVVVDVRAPLLRSDNDRVILKEKERLFNSLSLKKSRANRISITIGFSETP